MTLTAERVSEALEKAQDKLAESTSAYLDEKRKLEEQIGKLKTWLWNNTQQTADVVVGDYVKLRDERSALKKLYEEDDNILKDEMALRENWLLRAIQSIGGESVRTAHGTAFIQTKTRSNCSDWPSFWKWIATHERFDMLEKRVAQRAMSELVENGQELPPGINLHQEQEVQIRRS